VRLTPADAALAVVAALALGICGARWFAAEREQDAAAARGRAAGRAVWRGRRMMLGVVLVAAVLFDLWTRGKGHRP
jgi:hypothetical protein